jgi:hypothetical protein
MGRCFGGCFGGRHQDGSKGSKSVQTAVPSLVPGDRVIEYQLIKDNKQHEKETTIQAI